MGDKPAELSQATARHLESALAAAGGSFTLTPLNGRLAYVAMLPLRPVADAQPPLASESTGADSAEPASLDGLFVLAIDDQEEARDALEAVLSTSGARVRLFASGREALDWLRATDPAQWPQVLLCDLVLAGEDGYDVLRRLRELEGERPSLPGRPPPLPAIALTGYTDALDEQHARGVGFDAHLNKPVPPEELIAAIRRLAPVPSSADSTLPG
ncbi:CheY-like chemotaxis protein [Paraburkholderia sp. JPY465]